MSTGANPPLNRAVSNALAVISHWKTYLILLIYGPIPVLLWRCYYRSPFPGWVHDLIKFFTGNSADSLWDLAWFSATLCTLYLIYVAAIVLIFWRLNIDQLSKAWTANWPTVSMNSGLIGFMLAFWSWFAPGNFWNQLDEKKLLLDDDRTHVIEWHADPASGEITRRERVRVNFRTEKLIGLHRQCAVFWLGFWTLVPPMWFLLEYSFVIPREGAKNGFDASRLKELQGLASKMWLAWIIMLATWHGVPKLPWMK